MAEETTITSSVLAVLKERPKRLISTVEIQDALPNFEGRQVTNAMAALARSRPEVQQIARGSYMYLPTLNGRNGNGTLDEDEEEEYEPEAHVAQDPTVDEVNAKLADLPPPAKRGLSAEAKRQPEVSIETITPAKAAEWLTTNVKNRDLRLSRVIWLSGILNRGEWELTNDAISFDSYGYLRNGQHRLSSIFVSGKSAQMIVLRGIKAKAQDVMDRVVPRSMADALKMRQEAYSTQLGAALGWLYRLDYERQTGQIHYRNSGERPTTPQLLKLLDDNPGIRESVVAISRCLYKADVPLRSGVASALHYTFSQIHPGEAEMFFDQLVTGASLAQDSAIFVLRRQLMQDKGRRSYERMADYREAALLVKAWNAWREQRPVTNLTWKYGPTHREPFPHPE